MPLGAFAPLPLRLGGTAEEGWTAEQHSRTVADLVAVRRTQPWAVVHAALDGLTITAYLGPNGNGVANGPSTSRTLNVTTFTFPATFEDDFGNIQRFNIQQAAATANINNDTQTVVEITAANVVKVEVFRVGFDEADAEITLKVWCPNDVAIDRYGGTTSKENSKTEGNRPIAWVWYRMLNDMRGSGFSKDLSGTVHVENLAIARLFGWLNSRLPEKIAANATPARADELLDYWATVLAVSRRAGDTDADVRRRCTARFKAALGPTHLNVQDSVDELIPDDFDSLIRSEGTDLENPPPITFWPGVNPGPASHDLGGGPWLSERAHLGIKVDKPAGSEEAAFLARMNIDLFDHLDRLLPAWATFDWTTSTGFLLDISDLDFDGLGD